MFGTQDEAKLVDSLTVGIGAAALIEENWESGDLAGAVRLLLDWQRLAIELLRKKE